MSEQPAASASPTVTPAPEGPVEPAPLDPPPLGPRVWVKDRAVVIDRGFAGLQKWSLRLVVVAAAAYVLGWVLGHTWMVWFPVAMALVLSTLLAPPVTWLRHHRVPSGLAAGLVMLAFLGVLVGVVAVLVPQVVEETPTIADSAVSGLTEVRVWLTDGPLHLSDTQITNAIAAAQDQIQSSAAIISAGVVTGLGAVSNALINIFLILILTFLFIKDGHKLLPFLETVGGRRIGRHVTEVSTRAWTTLGGFIRTQALVSLIDAVLIGTGLLVLGVPLAVPLAILVFFGGFIPIVGALITGVLAVLVTLVTNDFSDAVIVAIIILAVQQLEGNVLSPWLQGKSMNLHAGIVLLSVTAGSTLFGITGAFLAVPVAATVKVLLSYLNERVDAAVGPGAPPEDSHAAPALEEEITAQEAAAVTPGDAAALLTERDEPR